MQLITKKSKSIESSKGFTLIELLVSIALFSVVLTITLGSIMTIVDSNKKARSLMSVTNNLNFAIDSMTRSFKSGEIEQDTNFILSEGESDNCFQTKEQDYDAVNTTGEFEFRGVKYCWEINGDQRGEIVKYVASGSNFTFNGLGTPITSSDIDIKYLKFFGDGYNSNYQPILTVVIEAEAKISEKITSQFTIQTSVSQLKLNN